jgi:hypothetical protein
MFLHIIRRPVYFSEYNVLETVYSCYVFLKPGSEYLIASLKFFLMLLGSSKQTLEQRPMLFLTLYQ